MNTLETLATFSTHDTGRRQTQKHTAHKKTRVLAKDKQFLLLIRHPPCYSYSEAR
jgi:hypothetical protein